MRSKKAWRELLDRGYLKHYCMIDSRGAFVHSYELMQEPSGTPARMTHVAGMDRENGDLRMVLSSEKKRDFVRVPNALLRSQTLPLAVKGLFSVVAHLAGIPNFSLNPDGIRSFCKEKAKHFATLWRALKLFGLLKQHRRPAGMECHFSYEYELLDTPDTDAPYLVNHHADGSVSSSRTIADYISGAASRLKAWLSGAKQEKNRRKNIVRKADAPLAPAVHTDKRADEMRRQIDADRLSERFGPQAANLVVKALTSLAGAPDHQGRRCSCSAGGASGCRRACDTRRCCCNSLAGTRSFPREEPGSVSAQCAVHRPYPADGKREADRCMARQVGQAKARPHRRCSRTL